MTIHTDPARERFILSDLPDGSRTDILDNTPEGNFVTAEDEQGNECTWYVDHKLTVSKLEPVQDLQIQPDCDIDETDEELD